MRNLTGLKVIIVMASSLTILACASHGGQAVEQWPFRSIVALIANPDEYHGKVVQTEGVAVIGFEVDAIFLSRDDVREGALLNSVALSLHDVPMSEEEKRKLDGQYVIVRGVFTKHPNELRGGISQISRIYVSKDSED
jgi:hypothetical protein